MICIFSTAVDISTTDVMRWLHHLGHKDVIRVNYREEGDAEPVRLDVTHGTFSFQQDGRTIHLEDIDAVWYRKGKNWLCDQFYSVTVEDHDRFTHYLNKRLQAEEMRLAEYIHHIVENTVPVLGAPLRGNLNKLLVLAAAREVGLLTPELYITNYKDGVNQVLQHTPDLITKSISDGIYLFEHEDKKLGYFTYTETFDGSVAHLLPENISPSLLQNRVHKKYEVRVFYLDGDFYSMVIFSQRNERTKVDFRRYDEIKSTRYTPYKLPGEMEQKLANLFNKLELNTGSVDLMLDENDQFYFLEINPVGQFGMVSTPCNYYLEKQVALKLIEYAGKNRNN